MHVLVTGSRDLSDPAPLFEMLQECLEESSAWMEELHLILGDCQSGADLYALAWALEIEEECTYVDHEVFVADWSKGNFGGPLRNSRMVEWAKEMNDHENVVVLAFYQKGAGNRGTRNCVAQAERAGLEVIRIEVG